MLNAVGVPGGVDRQVREPVFLSTGPGAPANSRKGVPSILNRLGARPDSGFDSLYLYPSGGPLLRT